MRYTVYVIAGVLEGLGIGIVVLDFRDVRDRLRSYKSQVFGYVDATTTAAAVFAATADVEPLPSLETRVQNLENTIEGHAKQHADEAAESRRYARAEAEQAVKSVQQSVGSELTRLIDLVFALNDPDTPGWRRWWLGPALLAAGLVLGVIGNVISAW